MRYLLIALGLWFGLEMVFVVILLLVTAVEGHRARRETAWLEERFLHPWPELDRVRAATASPAGAVSPGRTPPP
jgi:hypothetical protein